MALIEVRNLEKVYASGEVSTHALRGVNLDIKDGEFVAVMGPSGSGKSTLLHILGFLDRQTRGSYIFDNRSIDDYSEKELAKIRNKKMGFVFQTFNLLPRSSILENVELPLIYLGLKGEERKNIAEEAIKSVGLYHRITHEPSQLSGGEKQRVAIARALVNKPSVIFADEPTGNLDTQSGKQVMEIIRKLNDEQGHTVVLITHETYTARYAERVINLLDGELESDNRVDYRTTAEDFIK